MIEPKTIFLIAGEPSGDARGAELVHALKEENPSLRFEGLGGPKMQAAGVKLIYDLTTISALGFSDVVKQYLKIRKIFYDALTHVQNLKPTCIVLIDYPGFNIRFAKKIKKQFPVFYYVSPQIWAWGKRRIHTIKRVVHHMLVLFKFEEALYQNAGIPVTWVGHPLLESVQASKEKSELKREFGIGEEKTVGLLPGSRKSEIERILPIIMETARQIAQREKRITFLLSESSNVSKEIYDSILKPFENQIKLVRIRNRMYDIAVVSDCAIVTSGTATLETTILKIPFVLIYKAAWLTYFLGKHLIRIPFLGISNIIAGKKIISEYIQEDAHPETISEEVLSLLNNEQMRSEMITNLEEVRKLLGPTGASKRAAKTILKLLNS
ncbi:MAG: lipid-A-disaccharide synthase [Candidatus Omnitrophica bacterium]|nr:lipid-A-disaccharide synthase [Candidatus Omnitrophota bacterium]